MNGADAYSPNWPWSPEEWKAIMEATHAMEERRDDG